MSFIHRHLLNSTAIALLVSLMFALFSAGLVQAAESAGSIAQGFKTTETNLTPGALMSLKQDESGTVELANTSRVEHLVGVVADKSLVEFAGGSSEVKVVTSGVSLALVSDLNGDIQTGDRITAAPIDGIGMKAASSTQVVGVAQADFSSLKTTTHTITDRDGNQQTVKIGQLPIQVDVAYYAVDDTASFLPPFFQNLANTIAGRQVSAIRVIIAALALLLAFVCIAVLLYSAVKSSITSIGRNPLSEVAVRKSLFEVGLTVTGILLLTLITIYLILTT